MSDLSSAPILGFDRLVEILKPYAGDRVRVTFSARGSAGFTPTISGVLEMRDYGHTVDPLIDGKGGWFYADGCVVKLEAIAPNGRYCPIWSADPPGRYVTMG